MQGYVATDVAGTPPERFSPYLLRVLNSQLPFSQRPALAKTGATLTWTLQVIPSTSSSSHTLRTGTKIPLVGRSTLQDSLPSRAPLGRGRLKLVPGRDRERPQEFTQPRFAIFSGFASVRTDAKWLRGPNTHGEFNGIQIISQRSSSFLNTLFIYNKGFLLLFLFLKAHLSRVTLNSVYIS